MRKNELLLTLAIISVIFLVGFFLRVESTNIPGIPSDEKAYYEDQYGLPYMYELDSYYNYRLTKNYLDHGYMGDTKVNGRDWDFHSYAPSGVPMDYPPLIVYLTAFIYKFINLFTAVPLMVICFWLPTFVGPLAGFVAYFFVRRYTNNYGAVAAGILAVTAPLYFVRTVPGWFDTDMFNVFFPLLVTWLFVEAVQCKNSKNRIFLTFASIISMYLFAIAWDGWQYQFYLMIIFTLVYILFRKLRGIESKNCSYVFLSFFAGTLILITIFTGYLNVLGLFLSPLDLIKMNGHQGLWGSWPNIYTSVSELQKPSLEEIISGIGISFFGGLIGFLWILRVLIKKDLKQRLLKRMTWFFYSFLLFWTIVGFCAISEGARFIIMIIPPLIIVTGIFVGLSIDYVNLIREKEIMGRFIISKNFIRIVGVLIVILISLPAISNACGNFNALIPGANDDLWSASEWISNNTSNDTIIVSEWSYGHLFTAVADRPVLMDGRLSYIETMQTRNYDKAYVFGNDSPSTAHEYWVFKAFSTDNQSLSLGIFNMLTTSGDTGYLTLNNYTKNTTKTVDILDNILGVNKDSASNLLIKKYNLTPEESQNVLKYTHPEQKRQFVLLTSDYLLNKGHNILYFGSWDFNKGKGENMSYSFSKLTVNGNILKANNGLIVNLKDGTATFNGQKPYAVIKVKNGIVNESYIDKNSTILIILLLDSKKSVVMDKRFENSMFTKLVVEKETSDYFKPIYKNKSVVVWKPAKT